MADFDIWISIGDTESMLRVNWPRTPGHFSSGGKNISKKWIPLHFPIGYFLIIHTSAIIIHSTMLLWLHFAVAVNKGGGWVMWQDKCITLDAAKWAAGSEMSPTLKNNTFFFSNLEGLKTTVQTAAAVKHPAHVTQLGGFLSQNVETICTGHCGAAITTTKTTTK